MSVLCLSTRLPAQQIVQYSTQAVGAGNESADRYGSHAPRQISPNVRSRDAIVPAVAVKNVENQDRSYQEQA
jgi:hypothetical protein